MYKIKNISLDSIFEEFNTKNLMDLRDEDLEEICERIGVSPVYFTKVQKQALVRQGLDPQKTVNLINATKSVSMYMSQVYWTARQRQLDARSKIVEKMVKTQTGEDTFSLMQDTQIGFYNLKPGASVELDVTDKWLEEIVRQTPAWTEKMLEIRDDDNDKLTFVKSVSTSGTRNIERWVLQKEKLVNNPYEEKPDAAIAPETVKIEGAGFHDLQQMFKRRYGKLQVGLTAQQLREKIAEYDSQHITANA